jgi:integrase
MASLYEKKGWLYLSWTDSFGKRHQDALRLRADREGKFLAKRVKAAKERELAIDPLAHTMAIATDKKQRSGTKLSELRDLAEKENGSDGEKKAKNTVRLWKLSANKLIECIGDVPVAMITPETMHAFRTWAIEKDGKENAAAWIRNLGGLFKQAKLRHLIPSSPITEDVRIRQERKPVVAMTQEEVQKLFVKAHEMKGIGFLNQLRFLAYTGFRANESCAIRRRQIFFDRGYIEHINIKGKRTEPFPIYSKLVELLEPMRNLSAEDFLFEYRSVDTLSHYFTEVRDKLKLDKRYTLHTLKKVFVSTLIQSGVHQMNVNRLANHMDMQTTRDHYVWFDIDPLRMELERVANLLP